MNHYNKERNLRCSCCNKVASDDIATDLFELDTQLYFRQDPRDPTSILCSECIEVINESVREFEEEIIYEYWK